MSSLNPLTAGATLDDGTNPGVYIGEVTRVDGDVAYVEIPRLVPDQEWPGRFGPAYTPVAGHNVAVGFLEGGRDEVIILLRLP